MQGTEHSDQVSARMLRGSAQLVASPEGDVVQCPGRVKGQLGPRRAFRISRRRFRLLHNHATHQTFRMLQSHREAQIMSRFLGTHNEGTMTAAACMAGVMVPFKRISRRNGQAGGFAKALVL